MSIFILLLVLFVLAVIWVVTACFAIVWYEYSNSDPSAVDDRFSAYNLLLTAQLLLGECAPSLSNFEDLSGEIQFR